MKILHLADLHLGKRVNEFSMLEDQRYILNQILDIVEEEAVEVVMICGDVYDKGIPPVDAIELLDDFLWKLAEKDCRTLMISGNHDSGDRLGFGKHLFQNSNLFIVSQFSGEIEKITIPCGNLPVNFYMLPFVKPVIVNQSLGIHTQSYQECLRYLIEHTKIDPEEMNLLMAHQFVTAGKENPELSDSETSSLGGIDNVDYRIFDPFDYVALGHIHKPQAMGRPQVRYSGSILKYSFSEIRKEKEVVLLHIEENKKMEMSFRKLKPLRDMREIKGTIRQLMEGEIRLGNQEDYMQVTLTDEEEILDAIGKVRTVFPNVMQICLENRRYARQQQIRAEEQDILHQDPLQLFAEFYKMQNNIELEEEEAEKIKTIFEEVRQ
ncbi:MAG TPA: exonuclease SbcCD subunit D [Candidatus Anaerostipes avicola]|uniref:exonuclease SbcCD subunit D n=1 Tax=Anaerostipes butyraticus TaxID=645466 RepID=UPI001F9C5A74|nr:exonuclease SbcCD subunit D [Anaerostipes butyraticus]HJC83609.1 exonuclease SbcCD subunit D [Candidatus Anaerostipes avicola]